MSNQEFLEMILLERIDVLLSENIQKGSEEVMETAERVLRELSDGDRAIMEQFHDQLRERELEHVSQSYLAGMRDGMLLLVLFWKYLLSELLCFKENEKENEHGEQKICRSDNGRKNRRTVGETP